MTVERDVRGRWRRYTDDLGLQILWRVDEAGAYTAQWEVPHDAPRGTYRLRVTANRYTLASREFGVVASNDMRPVVEGGRVRLLYPPTELTWRPEQARRLVVTFRDGARRIRRSGFGSVAIPPGADRIADGDARDAYNNTVSRDVALP